MIAPLPSFLGSTVGTCVPRPIELQSGTARPRRYDKAMTDLLDQGAAAIASAIRAGKTSAREVAEAGLHDRPLLAIAQRAKTALA